MGAKSLYLDTRLQIIRNLIFKHDIEAIKSLDKDYKAYKKYSKNWPKANLDEFIQKFNIDDKLFNMTSNKRKISFFNNGQEYEIICAIGAKYFRVKRIDPSGGKGVYVDLNLKEPKINSKLKFGNAKAERERLTHFKMTYKKGVN